MKDNIMVSIVCNTYNQEKYIETALKGFLMQETDFKYEILVHDDCSKDNTPKIVKEYEEKYPDKILPIYQKENQWSKDVNISMQIQFPRARGKYIALCEGDDYWIDPLKLQKQVDYMEAHPDCTFCFTNAKCEVDGKYVREVIPWADDSVVIEGNIYDVDAIERLNYIPTASFLFRAESVSGLMPLRAGSFSGDGYYKLGFTAQGYAYYFPECTSVYRYSVPHSATTEWRRNYDVLKRNADSLIGMYEDMDKYFQGKYPIFRERVIGWEINRCFATGEFEKLRHKKYKDYYKQSGRKGYPVFWFATTFPALYKVLRNIKRKI